MHINDRQWVLLVTGHPLGAALEFADSESSEVFRVEQKDWGALQHAMKCLITHAQLHPGDAL